MLEIRRLDIKSTAKVSALVFSVIYTLLVLFSMLIASLGLLQNAQLQLNARLLSTLLLVPIIGAFMGYVFGALFAGLYNLIAARATPLKLEIVEEETK
ncbi:MAG: hypothetical protein ABH829_03410 [archaeon]